jgi:predicted PurR-regulated permease PerM
MFMRPQRKSRNGAIGVADQPSRTHGRNAFEIPAGFFGVLSTLTIGLVVALLYFARDIIVPIALAVLLSFLLAPAVRGLRRLQMGRVPAVTLTVLIAFLAMLGFAAIVVQELTSLAQQIPAYRSNLEAKIRSIPEIFPGGGIVHRVTSMVRELGRELTQTETRISNSAENRSALGTSPVEPPAKPVPVEIQRPEFEPLQIVRDVVGPLLQPLAMAGLVIVFVIMILLEREDLRDRLLRLAGRRDLHRTTVAMDDAATRISRYLSRQLVVNACCGLPIGFGLALIGIPNAALWGIFAALLRFLPYIGIVIAACFPLALAVAVDPGWMLLVWVILLFVGIELVVANLLEPRVYAASTGLSSVALITAATFWTWLWGPIGLLLSTPLTVCLIVLGRHVPQLEFLDVILGNNPVLAPDETFYQRLLANDPEEAAEQAEEFLKERSLAEFFDEVAIPALVRAQADSDQGTLSPERRLMIKEGIRAMLEDLSDVASGDAASEHSARSEVTEIVCVAGRNELDEAAGLLLVHLLRSQSIVGVGEALPAAALTSDRYQSSLEHARVICLSLISTHSPVRARYIVRRISRRAPRSRVMVGFWRLDPGELAATVATIARPDAIVVTSLRDAVMDLQSDPSPDGAPASAVPAIRATDVSQAAMPSSSAA